MTRRRAVEPNVALERALRGMAHEANAGAILLASRIACGQLEVLLRFAAAFDRVRDARRFSKMIDEISQMSRALAPTGSGAAAPKERRNG
jgi:hypothetical protein